MSPSLALRGAVSMVGDREADDGEIPGFSLTNEVGHFSETRRHTIQYGKFKN